MTCTPLRISDIKYCSDIILVLVFNLFIFFYEVLLGFYYISIFKSFLFYFTIKLTLIVVVTIINEQVYCLKYMVNIYILTDGYMSLTKFNQAFVVRIWFFSSYKKSIQNFAKFIIFFLSFVILWFMLKLLTWF